MYFIIEDYTSSFGDEYKFKIKNMKDNFVIVFLSFKAFINFRYL